MEKRENDSERLRHIILLSLLVRAGPIRARLWTARACSDCTTGPPLSPLRDTAGLDSARCNQGRIVQLKLHKRNTPPRLLSRLMARVYIGFHQQSHYPTAESALADRCNACRIHPSPLPQNPLKTAAGHCSVWRSEEKHACGASWSNLLPG